MTAATKSAVLDRALAYLAAGVSVIPIALDGTKVPPWDVLPRIPDPERPDRFKSSWKPFQERTATDDEVLKWWDRDRPLGIAAVCGAVSGGLECLDFDDRATVREFLAEVKSECPGLYTRLCLEETPAGAHVWYRCAELEANKKLASPSKRACKEAGKKFKALIETRGEGGYAIVEGGPVEVHATGLPYRHVGGPRLTEVAEITPGERDYLFRLGQSFDRSDPPESGKPAAGGELSPADDYDLRGEPFSELLSEAHFQCVGRDEGKVRRPDKERGYSATVGHCRGSRGEPLLKVFTTSWPPFEGDRCYGRFHVLRLTKFGGDGAATMRHLRGRGFGSPRPPSGFVATASENGAHPSSANGKPAAEPGPVWRLKPKSGRAPGAGENAAALLTREFPPPRYAVDGLLVEGLTILGGRPKQGKSWLSLLIAWAVAGGRELDGRAVQQGEVLYLGLEDTPRRLQKRLRTLNATAGWPSPQALTLHTDWPRAGEGGLYHLADWLEAQKGRARLVVIDTMAKFRDPQKGNSNGYADDYEAVGNLQRLFSHYEVAALVNHHTRKLHAQDPFDELSGTMGVSGATDSMWVLDRTRGSAAAELFVTGRDLPEGTVPLAFDKLDCRWKLAAVREGIDTAGRAASPELGKLEACKEWLKEYLAEYAYPSKEIDAAGRAAGYAPTTIRDAKVALGSKGTGEVVHHNYGFGQDNDWWSGVGDWQAWKRRPAPTAPAPERETESRQQAERKDLWG